MAGVGAVGVDEGCAGDGVRAGGVLDVVAYAHAGGWLE